MKQNFLRVLFTFTIFILLSNCDNADITKFSRGEFQEDGVANEEFATTLFIKNLASNLNNTIFVLDICIASECVDTIKHQEISAPITDSIVSTGIPLFLLENTPYRIHGKIINSTTKATKFEGSLDNYTVDTSNLVIELQMIESQGVIDTNSLKNIFPVVSTVNFSVGFSDGAYQRTGTVYATDPNLKPLQYSYKLTDSKGVELSASATNISGSSYTFSVVQAGSYIYQITVSNGAQSTVVAYSFLVESVKAIFNVVPDLKIINPLQNAVFSPSSIVTLQFSLSDDNKDLCADEMTIKQLEMYDAKNSQFNPVTLDSKCQYQITLPGSVSTYKYTFVYYDQYGSYSIAQIDLAVKM